MKNLVTATDFVLLLSATGSEQDWQSSVNQYGHRKAQVSADGKTPDGVKKTTLTIECSSGNDGAAPVGKEAMKGCGNP